MARDDVAPERPAGWSGDARHVPPGWSQQNVAGSGRAQQALQGAGSIQYNYFGISGTPPETALSIAPPLGQRDQRFPLRGRDSLVEELAGLLLAGQHRAGPPVRVLHGLGGCGKTSIALEVASQACSRGIDTWWVPAAEDGRFRQHHGFDWIEMQKVLEDDIKRQKVGRGGSTITQQLVKNLFLTTERSFIRKGAEFALVPLVEAFLTKDRILELYLNVIEWGPGIYGAEAASQHYYHLPASSLSREQAARLAAIIPAPLKRKPERMNEYSAEILDRMEQTGW